MEYNITVTKHASLRMRKRLGIPKKSVNKISTKAYWLGVGESQVSGVLKKYIQEKNEKGYVFRTYKIYGNDIYVFDQLILITVMHIPGRYQKYLNNTLH